MKESTPHKYRHRHVMIQLIGTIMKETNSFQFEYSNYHYIVLINCQIHCIMIKQLKGRLHHPCLTLVTHHDQPSKKC